MPSAYTAKPADAADTPDVPPGWLPGEPGSGGPGGGSAPGEPGGVGNWPYPGPYPPGYSPTLTYVIETGTWHATPARSSQTSRIIDSGAYKTREPLAADTVVWSLTVDGELRQLKFDGGSFGDTISQSYDDVSSSWDEFWGSNKDIRFNTSAPADTGRTYILTATATFHRQTAVGTKTGTLS